MTASRGLAVPRADWPPIVGGAVLMALAYPPFHLLVPSFVCLVPAVLLLDRGGRDTRPVRRQAAQGFWFGLLTQGAVLYWMVVALWHFTPLSVLAYAATILVLATYHAVLFGAAGEIVRRTGLPLLVVFPVLWTALEWVVGHQGDLAFPWLGLGTSLTGYPTLIQIADLVGARGVTFLLAVANVAIAGAWLDRRRPGAALRLVGVGAGVLAAVGYGVWRERTIVMRAVGAVALVQPAVGYEEKYEPDRRREIFDDLLALSREAADRGDPTLIVWPEAAVPAAFPSRVGDADVGQLARDAGVPVVVGATDVRYVGDGPQGYEYWNAAFVYDGTGNREPYPVYHKYYLVPITERVPFVNPRWFALRFFGGFAVGEPGAVYDVGPGPFGILICYESAFEDLTRRYRRHGAAFVVNMTNDAWFGRTTAPAQHLAHLVMRAIENRVGVARAANTGISAFVDPLGHLAHRSALGVRTVVQGTVWTSTSPAPYTRLGDWVGVLSVVGSASLVGAAWWRRT